MSVPRTHIDLIGDIHGHAVELEALLKKLGYKSHGGDYRHDEGRTVIFLGDYIDRGPKIKQTLALVHGMVEAGNAVALMGNHEYNALCFNYEERKGGHVREHSIKNILQHVETLRQFKGDQLAYDSTIEWFKTLPLYHESDEFRAVHACWDEGCIKLLRKHLKNGRLTEPLIRRSADEDDPIHEAVKVTLTGREIKLPKPLVITDKDGHERSEMRIKWWVDPVGATYHSLGFPRPKQAPKEPIRPKLLKAATRYPDNGKPVFFGHYWLQGAPKLQNRNVCCLDYSVARKGQLLAYRFDGERKLNKKNLVPVKAILLKKKR